MLARTRNLAVLAALALALTLFNPSQAAAAAHFVSTAGNDFVAGTIDSPWQNLWTAIPRLAPGDTLYIRGGRYHQWNLRVAVSGTAGAPIVIRAYPGELVTLDTSFQEFRTPGNAIWRTVDPLIGHYITRTSVDEYIVTSWVTGMPGYENERVRLTPYGRPSDFTSTTEVYDAAGFYTGPGAFEGGNRLEVRLAKTADLRFAEVRNGRIFDEEIPNPADYSIVATGASAGLYVTGSYVVIKDLEIETGYDTILLGAGVHHVVLDGLTVWIGHTGIKVGGPASIT